MSVLDRAKRLQTETNPADTPSSSLAPADAPVIHRLRQIFNEVYKHAEAQGRMAWILKSVTEEVLDVIVEQAVEGEVADYLLITSQVIRWVATGEIEDLPDMFKEHALELEAPQAIALPAEDDMVAP